MDCSTFALDLHVLAMPPAFNLSQDQTLQLIVLNHVRRRGNVQRKGEPWQPLRAAGSERETVGHAGTTIRRQRAANPLDCSRTSCHRQANLTATRSSLN